MQPDAVNFLLAIVFTVGCMTIHACRCRPDDATVLLMLLMVGLLNLLGAAMLARIEPNLDPAFTVEILSHRPHHD